MGAEDWVAVDSYPSGLHCVHTLHSMGDASAAGHAFSISVRTTALLSNEVNLTPLEAALAPETIMLV